MSEPIRLDVYHDTFVELHDRFSFALRDAGLRDHALDRAICAAIQATIPILVREQEHRKKMAEALRVVN